VQQNACVGDTVTFVCVAFGEIGWWYGTWRDLVVLASPLLTSRVGYLVSKGLMSSGCVAILQDIEINLSNNP
tara:strand:- start:345 stop:560 length:216 start_codon:yes stop_codon:yes gene_type:complete